MNSINRFVSHVRHAVEDSWVPQGTFHFSMEKGVRFRDDSFSNGYFESEGHILAVAAGKPVEQWLPTLAHEYGHLTQWKDHQAGRGGI